MLATKISTPIRRMLPLGRVISASKSLSFNRTRRAQFSQPNIYKAFVNVEFTKGDFTVKTVNSRAEFIDVLRLRYKVFHKEYMNKRFPFGLDIDEFDSIADHLIVIDNRKHKVVGAYRFISSEFSKSFYSESEFDLKDFINMPGTKLELSRACIHRKYRTGTVLTLLWRGLMEYLVASNADYLFGIPSISSSELEKAVLVYKQLEAQGQIDEALNVRPTGEFVIPGFERQVMQTEYTADELKESRKVVPALMQTYFRAGAKVAGTPAYDGVFRCYDFFTYLPVKALTAKYERRFRAQ